MTRSDGTTEAVALDMVGLLASVMNGFTVTPAREVEGDGSRVFSMTAKAIERPTPHVRHLELHRIDRVMAKTARA